MNDFIENDYAVILSSGKWKEKRETILERDGYKCTRCFSPGTTWIPNSENIGGANVLIIENEPITEIPKTIECYDHAIFLHIHHKFYVIENGKMIPPWHYKSDDLMTLCSECHTKLHKDEIVTVFERVNDELIATTQYKLCPRCKGEGYLPEYSHVQNGICFKCTGKRIFRYFDL